VAPLVVLAQRELDFRGSYPLGFSMEEEPPMTMKKILDREKVALKVVWTQRESKGIEGVQLQRDSIFIGI
jgi:hypothetical protein